MDQSHCYSPKPCPIHSKLVRHHPWTRWIPNRQVLLGRSIQPRRMWWPMSRSAGPSLPIQSRSFHENSKVMRCAARVRERPTLTTCIAWSSLISPWSRERCHRYSHRGTLARACGTEYSVWPVFSRMACADATTTRQECGSLENPLQIRLHCNHLLCRVNARYLIAVILSPAKA